MRRSVGVCALMQETDYEFVTIHSVVLFIGVILNVLMHARYSESRFCTDMLLIDDYL